VMGVDATPLSALCAPPLTTVGFDPEAIVDVAVTELMAELGYPTQGEPGTAHFATVIQRRST
jgi:DNA-binding LacI/PurR family transcriptional regulator